MVQKLLKSELKVNQRLAAQKRSESENVARQLKLESMVTPRSFIFRDLKTTEYVFWY